MKFSYVMGLLLVCGILGLTSCSSDSIEDVTTLTPKETFEDIAFTYTAFERAVLREVNNVRIENNLSILKIVNTISQKAYEHNQHMLGMDEICHHNFNDRSSDIKSTFDAVGIGENIAYGNATAQEVVQAWMDSEEHRNNIMHEAYTHFGISIVAEDEDTHYYTNIFAIK